MSEQRGGPLLLLRDRVDRSPHSIVRQAGWSAQHALSADGVLELEFTAQPHRESRSVTEDEATAAAAWRSGLTEEAKAKRDGWTAATPPLPGCNAQAE